MKITFVADYFMKDLPGGSERSLQAIIDAASMPVRTVRSGEFRLRDYGPDDFIIFGNFKGLPLRILSSIPEIVKYAVIESDYKYCAYGEIETHERTTGGRCNCHEKDYGKRICKFYEGAEVLFWKSTEQLNRHLTAFPILKMNQNVIIGATYSNDELDFITQVAKRRFLKLGYAVFKSENWIKGYKAAVEYCQDHKLWRREIGKSNWVKTILKLSRCKGLVFMPQIMESCSRVTLEAHLLGLEVIVNKNVPVAMESWFDESREKIIERIKKQPGIFWHYIKEATHDGVVAGV
jgi:hypothetical protein